MAIEYYPQAGSDTWTVYERAGRYHADSDADNPESIRDCATRAECEARIEARAVELEEIRGEREAEGGIHVARDGSRWIIEHNPPPIPSRAMDWQAWPEGYDGGLECIGDDAPPYHGQQYEPTREAVIAAVEAWVLAQSEVAR